MVVSQIVAVIGTELHETKLLNDDINRIQCQMMIGY